MLSVILEQGAIVDGTASAPFRTDVGIVEDKIALIGDLSDREAVARISCRNWIVAPGFIDVHSQTDEQLLKNPQVANKLLQGCTSEIAGHGGRSAAMRESEAGIGFDAYLAAVAQAQPGTNIGLFAGIDDARASRADALTLLRDAWDAGAFGLSTAHVELDEVRELLLQSGATRVSVSCAAQPDRFETQFDVAGTMARDRSVHVSSLRIDERRNGAPLYRALERIERERARGAALTADTFPYVADIVALESLVPRRVWEPAFADLATMRAASALVALALDERYDRTILGATRDDDMAPWYGHSLTQYAEAHRMTPARAVLELLRENDGDVHVFLPDMREEELRTAFSAPFVFAGSAAGSHRVHSDDSDVVHPRAFGTMPRLLHRFAAQLHATTLEAAVARMTSEAADAFGIANRGRIAPGYYADIGIFDGKAFADRATYAQPRALPQGLAHVFVNGRHAVRDGVLTAARAGRVLRRGDR